MFSEVPPGLTLSLLPLPGFLSKDSRVPALPLLADERNTTSGLCSGAGAGAVLTRQ